MVSIDQGVHPADRGTAQRLADQRRAHLDHALALRLYSRMRARRILLLHPVPQGIREHIAAWLHRDGLVLAWASYVSGNGRRVRCEAQAFTPQQWWREGQSTWAAIPVTRMRLVSTTTLWPAPTGPGQKWPDLSF